MAQVPTFKLNTGATIPAVGMGCWRGEPGLGKDDELMDSLSFAIKAGYRHIDTATLYQNEAQVGECIKKSGVPRKEFFLTTKLASKDHHDVKEAVDKSLQELGTPYIDLYLMHWPQGMDSNGKAYPDEKGEGGPTFNETWAQMEEYCFNTGKARAIGVSNFAISNLEKLLKTAKVIPAANQIECHPYLPESKLSDYCASKGIHLTNYSPFGASHLPLQTDPDLLSIAHANNVTPGQICLSWAVQHHHSVCPKSANKNRIQENLHLIPLPTEEMEKIDSISKEDGNRRTRLNYTAANKDSKLIFGWSTKQLGWEIGFKTIGVAGTVE